MSLSSEKLDELRRCILATAYLDYRDFLEACYKWLKKNSQRYSYLQFAEDFGFSRTNVLHLVIKGRRPLTAKAAAKYAEELGLSGNQRRYFATLVDYQNARDSATREELFRELIEMKNKSVDSDQERLQLEFFSEWFHPAIYEMTHLDEFQSDANWIADRLQLRIRPEQVRKSLQLLESLCLIRYDADAQRHFPTSATVTTGDEIASVAVVRYHQKLIEMGKESITRVHEDKRDISAITVCVSPETAQKMKEEIRSFRKRLLAMAQEVDGSDAVYQMNVQLFPLTKLSEI